MPKGLGIMAAPTTAPPWRTPWTKAWRSMARLIARRTFALSKGGRLWLRMTLSLPFCLTSVMTSDGALFLRVSAMVFVTSRGTKASSRAAGHEVVRISLELHQLAALVLLEPERSRAHAALAQLGEGDVGRVHGGVAGGEHEEEGGLGPPAPEHDGMRLRRLDGLDVGVPVLAGAQAKLGRRRRRLADHVESVLDVARGEGLAVMPAHVLFEEEDEVAKVVLPRPPFGQLGDDRLHALERLEGMEDHDVRVARRHGPHVRDGGRLVDQQTRRVLGEK